MNVKFCATQIYNTLVQWAGQRIVFFAGGPFHVLEVSDRKKGVL